MQVSPESLVPSWQYLFTTQHVVVNGATDSGKTNFLRWIAKQMPATVLFVNIEEEDVPGRRIHTVEEYTRGLARREKLHDFVTHEDPEVATKQLESLRRAQFQIGGRLRPRASNGKYAAAKHWALTIVDEAHEYAPKGDRSGPLHRYVKRGRKRGIHVASSTQRPAELAHSVLTQSRTHVYFALDTYESTYFQTYGIALEEFRGWIEKPYHFVVTRGHRWAKFQPVPKQ